MNIHNFILQFVVLFAPFTHYQVEQVTPTLSREPDPKIRDIYTLHDKGVKTIISLRTNPEVKKQRLCDKLGMKWIQIQTGVFLTPTDEQFDQFRSIVNDPKNQPCYTACEVDMDRTSVYIAAYSMVDRNWSVEQVDQEFASHHQKKWWPVFRKYKRVVLAYAEKRRHDVQQANATIAPSGQERP